jgi:hypothetical protein
MVAAQRTHRLAAPVNFSLLLLTRGKREGKGDEREGGKRKALGEEVVEGEEGGTAAVHCIHCTPSPK